MLDWRAEILLTEEKQTGSYRVIFIGRLILIGALAIGMIASGTAVAYGSPPIGMLFNPIGRENSSGSENALSSASLVGSSRAGRNECGPDQ